MAQGKYTPPAISIAYDEATEMYQLMATSHSRTEVGGPRLFRAEPWPNVKWKHYTEAGASHDAEVLRAYLDECASGKRKGGEDAVMPRGWWAL